MEPAPCNSYFEHLPYADFVREHQEHIASCPQCSRVIEVIHAVRSIPQKRWAEKFEKETPDCLTDDQIAAVAEEDRPLPELAGLRKHLEVCPRCLGLSISYRRILDKLSGGIAP